MCHRDICVGHQEGALSLAVTYQPDTQNAQRHVLQQHGSDVCTDCGEFLKSVRAVKGVGVAFTEVMEQLRAEHARRALLNQSDEDIPF